METEEKEKIMQKQISDKVNELMQLVGDNKCHALIMVTAQNDKKDGRMVLAAVQGNPVQISEGLASLIHDNEQVGQAVKAGVALANLRSLTEHLTNK